MSLHEKVVEEFRSRFGAEPDYVVRAPGRVNIIGEHTDYSEGFVLPMAIDRATWIALRPRSDRIVNLYSMDHEAGTMYDLDRIERERGWQEYPKGVAVMLQKAGYDLSGWDGATICDVPLGAGLSSSASFELAVARAFACVSGFEWDAPKMAVLGQKAENDWVGVSCGIMDQMISAVGKQDHATLIDCRDNSYRHMPLPDGTSVVIMDTGTRRGLVESAYNERRRQCEEAAAFFGVPFLRDVTLERFDAFAGRIEATMRRRARHVITENARTEEAAAAMEAGDAARLGVLMNLSHESLRDDFEVTNFELNEIVRIAREVEGCIGARMTGAGFGGCAVALVDAAAAESFAAEVGRRYAAATSRTPSLYVCRASDGAGVA